jgi:hypothetical protein
MNHDRWLKLLSYLQDIMVKGKTVRISMTFNEGNLNDRITVEEYAHLK